MQKKKKWNTAMLIVFSVLATVLEAFSLFAVLLSAREMKHEGLTYSQWYEGSIYSFYFWLIVAVICSGLFLAAWYMLLFRKRKQDAANPDGKSKYARKLLLITFAALTLIFACESVAFRIETNRAYAANVECLAPYIMRFGKCLTAAVVSLELFAATLIGFARQKEKKRENGAVISSGLR